VIKCAQMRIPFLVSRSGPHAYGPPDRQESEHDDARPRQRPALPRVYRKERLVRSSPQPTALA
jgi:hypothetical protein